MCEVQRPKKKPKTQGLSFSSINQKSSPTPKDPSPNPHEPTNQDHQTNSSSPATAKTRILLLSDTHGKGQLPEEVSLSENIDVLIHTGDLSNYGSLEDYESTLNLISSIPASLKLVIPGNHDLSLDKEFWEKHSTIEGAGLFNKARRLFKNSTIEGERKEETKEGGETILLENGIHEYKLANGALLKLYAGSNTPYPPNTSSTSTWAFGHPSQTDIYNPPSQSITYANHTTTTDSQTLIPDNANLDIIMTHGPPKYRLDHQHQTSNQVVALGCPHLFRAVRRAKPKLHVFGHVHDGYGAEVVRWGEESGDGVYPDDDDVDDGIVWKMGLVGEVRGDGVRKIDSRGLKGRGEVGGREEGNGDMTMFVNAALMGSDGELENLPWLVELDLQIAQ